MIRSNAIYSYYEDTFAHSTCWGHSILAPVRRISETAEGEICFSVSHVTTNSYSRTSTSVGCADHSMISHSFHWEPHATRICYETSHSSKKRDGIVAFPKHILYLHKTSDIVRSLAVSPCRCVFNERPPCHSTPSPFFPRSGGSQ